MARYIDVDKALLELQKFSIDTSSLYGVGYSNCLTAVEDVLTDLIIADVVEVRRGEWITDENGVVICSKCGEEHEWQDFRATYCDMCGADMRERIEE